MIDPRESVDWLDRAAFTAMLDPGEQTLARGLVLTRTMLPDGWNATIEREASTIDVYVGDDPDDVEAFRFGLSPFDTPDDDGNTWGLYFVDDDGTDSTHLTLAAAVARGVAAWEGR